MSATDTGLFRDFAKLGELYRTMLAEDPGRAARMQVLADAQTAADRNDGSRVLPPTLRMQQRAERRRNVQTQIHEAIDNAASSEGLT